MLSFCFTCLFRLDKLGALDYYKVVVNKEKWRLMACIWLHAGLIHLFANMLSLLFIGVRLEQEFGFGNNLPSCFLLILKFLNGT